MGFALALALSACGDRVGMAPTLQPYFDEFYHEAKDRNVDVASWSGAAFIVDQISDGPDELNAVGGPWGLCQTDHIEFKREAWNTLGEYGRRWLVFHELGHCILGLDHASSGYVNLTTYKDYAGGRLPVSTMLPHSIMSPGIYPSEEILQTVWPIYADELFKKTPVEQNSLVLASSQIDEIDTHWRMLLDPVLKSYLNEARRYGSHVSVPDFDFRTEFAPGDTAQGFDVPRFAEFATQWMNAQDAKYDPKLSNVLRPATLEILVFSFVARQYDPRSQFDSRVEQVEGRVYPLSLRALERASGNPDFENHYLRHRNEYVRELFMGRALLNDSRSFVLVYRRKIAF